MQRKEILIVFTDGDVGPLGNVWRITAKRTDFYLEPVGRTSAFHLSVHGPNDRHPGGHRFHLRVDQRAAEALRARGDFINHTVDAGGYAIDGEEVAPNVFRVARIRWRWDLQRARFRSAASFRGNLPDLSDNRFGLRLSQTLEPNGAADIDVFISYVEPYWPDSEASLRDNARLGPLVNENGMWLTATSYKRSQVTRPTPEGLVPPLPATGEAATSFLAAGPVQSERGEIYWFVESVTSREFLESGQPWPGAEGQADTPTT